MCITLREILTNHKMDIKKNMSKKNVPLTLLQYLMLNKNARSKYQLYN